MSVSTAINIWVFVAPLIVGLGWWFTRKTQPDYYRIVLQSLVIAIACGFMGFGVGHGSGGFLPWWFFATHEFSFFGILLLLVWWVLISIVFLLLFKLTKEANKNWNKE